ncbi:MAG: tetratricopeptide repeat protein [Anaerolineales bacterium]|nr:tetratricopeptide repeat protein [Anaerolineales bacterium]
MPTATQLKETGLSYFRLDQYADAAQRFSEAAAAFEADGQPLDAAEMRNNLGVVRLAQKDWAGALAAVEGTPAVFKAAGDAPRHAHAVGNLARALEGVERLDEAAAAYEQAIDLYAALGPAENENRAACYKALSGIQIKQDKKFQALASMQSGLNLSKALSAKEKTLKGLLDQVFKLMAR